MKISIIALLAFAASGCAFMQEVTQEERIQIRQNMARLQVQTVQNKIIGYSDDKRNK